MDSNEKDFQGRLQAFREREEQRVREGRVQAEEGPFSKETGRDRVLEEARRVRAAEEDRELVEREVRRVGKLSYKSDVLLGSAFEAAGRSGMSLNSIMAMSKLSGRIVRASLSRLEGKGLVRASLTDDGPVYSWIGPLPLPRLRNVISLEVEEERLSERSRADREYRARLDEYREREAAGVSPEGGVDHEAHLRDHMEREDAHEEQLRLQLESWAHREAESLREAAKARREQENGREWSEFTQQPIAPSGEQGEGHGRPEFIQKSIALSRYPGGTIRHRHESSYEIARVLRVDIELDLTTLSHLAGIDEGLAGIAVRRLIKNGVAVEVEAGPWKAFKAKSLARHLRSKDCIPADEEASRLEAVTAKARSSRRRAKTQEAARLSALTFGMEPLETFPGNGKPWRVRCEKCGEIAVIEYRPTADLHCTRCADLEKEATLESLGFMPLEPFPGGSTPWRKICMTCGEVDLRSLEEIDDPHCSDEDR